MNNNPFFERLVTLIETAAQGKQKSLAEKLGVRPAVISKWIKRGSLPSSEQLENICRKLGVNLNWLVAGIGARFLPASAIPVDRETPAKGEEGKPFYWGDAEIDLISAGKRLREIRGDLPRKEVSDQSDVPVRNIKLAEDGEAPPEPRHLYWAASYGGTFADWIMTGEGPQTGTEADRLFRIGRLTTEEYALVAEGKSKYGPPITPEEREFLEMYRSAPDEAKKAARAVLSIYAGKDDKGNPKAIS